MYVGKSNGQSRFYSPNKTSYGNNCTTSDANNDLLNILVKLDVLPHDVH